VKILLDECVPERLRRDIVGHNVATVAQMGWAGIKNGALLSLGETQFDVLVTVDHNMKYQQNLRGRKIAIIVLCVRANKLALLRPLLPQVLAALATIQPGEVVMVGAQ
jgi:predicted nuclease of predicted toxin-antitoxin system